MNAFKWVGPLGGLLVTGVILAAAAYYLLHPLLVVAR